MVKYFLTIILMLSSGGILCQEDGFQELDMYRSRDMKEEHVTRLRQNDTCSLINVLSLCAQKLDACCIHTDTLHAELLCTDSLLANQACVRDLSVTNFCAESTSFEEICAHHIHTDELCVQDRATLNQACITQERANLICADHITVTDLCISGTFRKCDGFSANAAATVTYTYTLGNIVTFDTTYSGPIVQNPTRFIAPETGFYLVTTQVITTSLTGPTVIAGTPIGSLELEINDILVRQNLSPYLAFSTGQSSLLTSIVRLNVGDDVHVHYRIFVQDPNTGFAEYPGQVQMVGLPALDGFRSFLAVEYLRSDCTDLPCLTCDIPCLDCNHPCPVIPCTPCGIQPCEPCETTCTSCCNQ